jgi:eukaryotic-like serine/threonine-protein kinase
MIGRTVSHYRILQEIGSGGMGVVYKAEDDRLGRTVALKFLPIELTRDENAKKRLLREAQAVSALQHHNICTIHEVDQSDDGHLFICMDYYEGETLKDRLARGPLSAEDAIDIVTQVARGLEEAHRRGIVHRDIKPANVVITNQGVVKILDFGLAKLGGETKLTKTGSTVGTAAYMSPEQVRGEDLDQRSDIFSLGVVFHELLTGASPFSAEHEPAVMHKILNVAPPPLRVSGVKRAAELEPIVGRMLAKEPKERYPSAGEVLVALEQPAHGASATGRRPRRGVTALTVAVALLLAGVGAAALFAWKRPWHHAELQQRQLTSNPWSNPVGAGVISPDGRTLAVVDQTGLFLRAIESGESSPVKLPDGFSPTAVMPTLEWFPDGSQLLISGNMLDGTPCVWAIPVLGGRARKIRSDGDGATISRDGSRIAYMRPTSAGAEIWCADVSGENARRVLVSDSTGTINTWAVWSPKGSRLAYARATVGPTGYRITLESCDLEGHRREIFSSNSEQRMHWLTTLLWAPDGRLFFGLTDPPPSQRDMNLWAIHVDPSSGAPSGKPRRITQWLGLSAVFPAGVSTDGKRLSVGVLVYQSDCYVGRVVSADSALQDVQRLTLDNRMDIGPAWMPDGKSILFSSNRNGSYDVFRQALDASAAEPLVTGLGDQYMPRVTPDGQWILYLESRREEAGGEGVTRLMRLPVAGGPSEKVFDTQAVAQFRCAVPPATRCVLSTSDGAETVFTEFDPLRGTGSELARVSAGKLPVWDLSFDATRVAIIPDGPTAIIRTLSLEDRSIHDTTLDRALQGASVAWTADGTGWLVIGLSAKDEEWNLYHVAESGKTTRLLPKQMWMYSAVTSPDGRHVAYTSNTVDANVWLLEDF